MDLSERSILFNERATIPQGYNIRIKDALNEIKSGKYENPNGVIKMINENSINRATARQLTVISNAFGVLIELGRISQEDAQALAESIRVFVKVK